MIEILSKSQMDGLTRHGHLAFDAENQKLHLLQGYSNNPKDHVVYQALINPGNDLYCKSLHKRTEQKYYKSIFRLIRHQLVATTMRPISPGCLIRAKYEGITLEGMAFNVFRFVHRAEQE